MTVAAGNPTQPRSGQPTEQWQFTVVLRREANGPELQHELVTDVDLADAYSELWLDSCLRRGYPGVPMEAVSFRLTPKYRDEAAPRCAGFVLEATNPRGQTVRREYTIEAFQDVASRGAQRQVAAGVLRLEDSYYYELIVERRASTARTPDDPLVSVTAKNPPLNYLTIPLKSLLARARTVGTLEEQLYHVFYTTEALARAEQFGRKGAKLHPPIETGAVLIGPLCSCPETGELFVVVCDALEVRNAEESEFSLVYSSKTWARIQAVMKAKQAAPATLAHRILGQGHGHNFLPTPPCELCSKVEVCGRTSVFVSLADRTWSRAVFSRQPWQLCHIFGLNARGEQVQALYGLRDNRLLERGFHVIPDFNHAG